MTILVKASILKNQLKAYKRLLEETNREMESKSQNPCLSLPQRADCATSQVPPDFFSVIIHTQVFHLYFVKLKKYNKGVISF